MKHRIVVLGAGYAGAFSAAYLARQLHTDDFEIVVVNAEPDFIERLRNHQLAAGQDLRHLPLAACRAHEKVRFTYTKPDAETGKRFVEPHQLLAAGPRWYLIAFDNDRADWRTFRLDRVEALHRTGLRVPGRELPDGLDAPSWLTRSLQRAGTVQARVLLHTALETAQHQVSTRQGILEHRDTTTCVLTTYPDTPPYLAYNIALLPMRYTLLDPPELEPLLRAIGERALAATENLDQPHSRKHLQ